MSRPRRRLLLPSLVFFCSGCGQQPAEAPEAAGRRPNLVVYLIDTLRADHLGAYGYGRPTSPRIDAFAEGAILVREARAQSSWTKPAVATILTGLQPVAHGAQRRSQGLDEGVTTLAERLAAAGYQTAFFGTNPTVTAKFGFAQGFEEFRYLSLPRGRKRGHVDAAAIHEEVTAWLEGRDASRPFFLFVHTLDPHDPYRPREPYRASLAPGIDVERACCIRARELAALDEAGARARAAASIALYDAEIAQNDTAFGALLDELARRDLLDGSAVLLTSDHGEEFYDHGGWRHASTLYEEVLRVPFVLRLPGGANAGAELEGPIEQIDVAPTLIELAGLARADELPGRSWARALAGGRPPEPRPSFAWLAHPAFSIAAVKQGPWKRIRFESAPPPPGRPADELFDLARDPGETWNLSADDPRRAHRLAEEIAAERARAPARAGQEVPIDPELDRTLRALGYI
jgi:arylsulfatase A-like enzyme